MRFFRLYRLIRRNDRLELRRHPALAANVASRIILGLAGVYWAGLMLMGGWSMARMDDAFFYIHRLFPLLLAADFLMRFSLPSISKRLKPYLLLPVGRRRVIGAFLLRHALHWMNLLWMPFFLTFALHAVLPSMGVLPAVSYLVGIWLLFVANGFWFQLCRLLCIERVLWVLLPLAVAGGLVALEFQCGHVVTDAALQLADGFVWFSPWWSFPAVIVVLALLVYAQLILEDRFLYGMFSYRKDNRRRGRVAQFGFFSRFGTVGEYMQLETKLHLRNRVPRRNLLNAIIIVLLWTFNAASGAYKGIVIQDAIIISSFSFFGLIVSSGFFAFEGHYMDGLVCWRDTLYKLLIADYYFLLLALLVPLSVLGILMAVGSTPFSAWQMVACMVFAAGFMNQVVMRMVLYNTVTMPLHEVVMKDRGGVSWQRYVLLTVVLLLPIPVVWLLNLCFGEGRYVALLAIGLVFAVTHRIWLRQIYRRFMKTRYERMEKLRITR